jgi:hypothetical protein
MLLTDPLKEIQTKECYSPIAAFAIKANREGSTYSCKKIHIDKSPRLDPYGPLRPYEKKRIEEGLTESKKSCDLFSLFTSNIKKIHLELDKRKSQKFEPQKQSSLLSTNHTDNA